MQNDDSNKEDSSAQSLNNGSKDKTPIINPDDHDSLGKAVGHQARQLVFFVRAVFLKLLHLADDTDVEGTIRDIKNGIVLEGSNLWILICSVVIASIGLDTNSPAVIIGAMLISPLMSPILGIGLSIGINDRITLGKSVRNFGIAIFISLGTSVVYFTVTPFGSYTPEMAARTEPTLLDVLVAFFGGLAGIIAGSRSEKTNAIPGVAIATALMPPLCTAGYGFANGEWEVFGGAFYLFFINAVFISISTYVIVRFLKFPVVEVVNPRVASRARVIIYFVLFLLIVPSLIFLGKKLAENFRDQTIENFVYEHINANDDRKSVQWTFHTTHESDTFNLYRLRVLSFGAGSYINSDSLENLEAEINDLLKNQIVLQFAGDYDSTTLELVQSDKPSDLEDKLRTEIETDLLREVEKKFRKEMGTYREKDNQLTEKDLQIKELQDRIMILKGDTISFTTIKEEIKAIYPEIDELAIAQAQSTNFETDTTNFIAVVKWNSKLRRSRSLKTDYENRLQNFLEVKLRSNTVRVVEER